MQNCLECNNLTCRKNPIICVVCKSDICVGCYGFLPEEVKFIPTAKLLCVECEIRDQFALINSSTEDPAKKIEKYKQIDAVLSGRIEHEAMKNHKKEREDIKLKKEIESLEQDYKMKEENEKLRQSGEGSSFAMDQGSDTNNDNVE